jgi:hypothetical protein
MKDWLPPPGAPLLGLDRSSKRTTFLDAPLGWRWRLWFRLPGWLQRRWEP